MTRAVLVAFLTFCVTRVLLVTAAIPKATCAPGVVTMNKVSSVGKVLVHCPEGYTLGVEPPELYPGQTNVFKTPNFDENDAHPICDLCPGAGCKKADKGFELSIDQLPIVASKFYFRCDHEGIFNAGKKPCFVGIEVAPYGPLGPNTCAVEGGHIEFTVEEQQKTVTFACGEGRTLSPSDNTKAFNKDCNSEISLPAGATLTAAGDKTFHLKVETLPKKSAEICYVCLGTGKANPKSRCEVRVAIAGSDKAGARSAGGAARTAAALGLALVAVRFFHVC